jgi:hypothetical protein
MYGSTSRQNLIRIHLRGCDEQTASGRIWVAYRIKAIKLNPPGGVLEDFLQNLSSSTGVLYAIV